MPDDLDFLICMNPELPKETRRQAFFRYEVTCWANAIERGLSIGEFDRDIRAAIERELDSRGKKGFTPKFPFDSKWNEANSSPSPPNGKPLDEWSV